MKYLMFFVIAILLISPVLFAQDIDPDEPVQEGQTMEKKPFSLGGLILPVGMVLVFYFLLIRPQKKQQKKMEEMHDSLKINDVVVTNAGMIGKIVNIKKDKNTVVVRVDDTTNTKIEFQRQAIAGVMNEEKNEENS